MFFSSLESNIVIAVLPMDCIEENMNVQTLISISYIVLRMKNDLNSETIQAYTEQRSRTNVNTIKYVCY